MEQINGTDFELKFKQEALDDTVSKEELDLIRAFFPELMRDALILLELQKET